MDSAEESVTMAKSPTEAPTSSTVLDYASTPPISTPTTTNNSSNSSCNNNNNNNNDELYPRQEDTPSPVELRIKKEISNSPEEKVKFILV